MEPGDIDGGTVGTGVDVATGVGDGGIGVSSDGGSGLGDGDFFGDEVGDVVDFFFLGEAFPFFFLGDAFGFGLGDLPGVGEAFATASGFSSDETCAEAGATVRTLAISSHKQERATAHVTKRNLRRAEAPVRNFPARAPGAELRSVSRPATATGRSNTSRSAE